MYTVKELTIRKLPQSSLPHIRLHGKWLEELHFIPNTAVTATYKDSCLTLKTDALMQSKNNGLEDHVLTTYVTSRIVGKKPRTQLFLNGLVLKKYGFDIGDRIALTIMPNMIQITKINRYTTAEQMA